MKKMNRVFIVCFDPKNSIIHDKNNIFWDGRTYVLAQIYSHESLITSLQAASEHLFQANFWTGWINHIRSMCWPVMLFSRCIGQLTPKKYLFFLLKCCIYRINVSCDVLMLFNSENKITGVGLRSKAILAVSVCLLVLNFP